MFQIKFGTVLKLETSYLGGGEYVPRYLGLVKQIVEPVAAKRYNRNRPGLSA